MSSAMTEQIRAAVVAKMLTVPDVGNVHPNERYKPDGRWMQAYYATEIDGVKMYRGWYVRRRAQKNSRKGRRQVINTWEIRGFQGVSDEWPAELAFDALIDALIDAFWIDQNLGVPTCLTAVGDEAGLQLQDSGPVNAGGVLCHSALLILRTEHME